LLTSHLGVFEARKLGHLGRTCALYCMVSQTQYGFAAKHAALKRFNSVLNAALLKSTALS